MRLKSSVVAAAFAGAGLFAAPASADYMGTCTNLIAAWKVCTATLGKCSLQENAIVTQCKCHQKVGNDWPVIVSAVSKDGVCGKPVPTIEIPEPEPPNPPIIVGDGPRGGGGGAGAGGRPGAPGGPAGAPPAGGASAKPPPGGGASASGSISASPAPPRGSTREH